MASIQLRHPAQNSAVPAARVGDVLRLPELAGKAMWRGNELGSSAQRECVATGFDALDKELPGGGWPCRSLTEILQPQPSLCEWRLLGASLSRIVASGGHILLVSPPKHPHLPGLMQHGLHQHQMVWLDARTPAERLWTTEQLVKSNPAGAILSWLPQARPEQLRRLQVHAQSCDSPVFLFRPATAQLDASPAPLRLLVDVAADWQLSVKVFKRRGPAHEQSLLLSSISQSLADVLTTRMLQPSPIAPALEISRVRTLGSSVDTAQAQHLVH